MDRIDLLINTLKQQYQQKESPEILLQTLAQLQAELMTKGAVQPLHLGTAKIAVMMPTGAAASASPQQALTQPVAEVNETLPVTEPVSERADRIRAARAGRYAKPRTHSGT